MTSIAQTGSSFLYVSEKKKGKKFCFKSFPRDEPMEGKKFHLYSKCLLFYYAKGNYRSHLIT